MQHVSQEADNKINEKKMQLETQVIYLSSHYGETFQIQNDFFKLRLHSLNIIQKHNCNKNINKCNIVFKNRFSQFEFYFTGKKFQSETFLIRFEQILPT